MSPTYNDGYRDGRRELRAEIETAHIARERDWQDQLDHANELMGEMRVRIAALEAGEVTTEWGTRFYVGTAREAVNVHATFDEAEEEAAAYGGVIVSRRVSQWEVSS